MTWLMRLTRLTRLTRRAMSGMPYLQHHLVERQRPRLIRAQDGHTRQLLHNVAAQVEIETKV
jgi:hypothetical protein